MKKDINRKFSTITKITTSLRLRTVGVVSLLALTCLSALAQGNRDKHEVVFAQSNLVSNIPGAAQLTDPDMTNAWGVSFSPTSPFWISDNGTGVATLYTVTNDSSGVAHVTKSSLVVTIPGAGTPTGQVFDGNGSFNGDIFLFVSEDGTISGWRPALGTAAEVLAMRATAVYKGVALAMTKGGPLLLAANFAEGTLDAYGVNSSGDFALLAQFSDPRAPAGFAPFNIREIKNFFFVTFALQNAAKHDDVAGPGNGLIDVFNPVNGKFVRFATGSNAGGKLDAINSPWGLALAPKSFGQNADRLLVGNFGNGTIMTFNGGGQFGGLLEGTDDSPLVIDGLWALTFGNGGSAGVPDTLYFTAGPNDESDGLFGMLTPVMQKR
ncbi:MAG: hypothetical protein JWR26_3561 [Pedosphaera sp.]|nr:hypothetical protein [Pedosphaera sp.]